MLKSCVIRFCLLAFLVVSPRLILAEDPAKVVHKWASVEYPELPRQVDSRFYRTITLVNNTNTLTHKNTLDLYLMYGVESLDRKKPATSDGPPNAAKVVVRLHFPNGSIFDAKPNEINGVGIGNGGSVAYDYIYSMPWGPNVMEEGWLEIRFQEEVYWAEIPYGFTRNPHDPLPVSGSKTGKPVLAPTMEHMGDKDTIVPWLFAHYDLGRIQKGWSLELNLSNPIDARAELILYRDDLKVGKGMYLWNLHSPQTTFEIRCPNRTLGSIGMSVRLHGDGLRRSDSFDVSREPSEDRCWGTAIIKVDKMTYNCLIPSSLFQFQHGMADSRQKAVIPIVHY